MSKPFKAIVGLGNPGSRYQDTRHNAGFWLLERIARQCGAAFRREARFFADVAEFGVGDGRVRLLKPTTYMNESGRSVQALMRYFDIDVTQVLVAHDEIDLPVGTTRLKRGGGHGGHNGLRDIVACLSSSAFCRVRIGVGHPGSKEQVMSYVLGRSSTQERQQIESSMDPLLEDIDDLLAGRIERVMNTLHRRDDTPRAADGA